MNRSRSFAPTRIIVAAAVSVVALVALGISALFSGNDDNSAGPDAGATSTVVTETTTATEATTTTLQLAADWYEKSSSRYSERQPTVTVSTLTPETTSKSQSGSTRSSGASN